MRGQNFLIAAMTPTLPDPETSTEAASLHVGRFDYYATAEEMVARDRQRAFPKAYSLAYKAMKTDRVLSSRFWVWVCSSIASISRGSALPSRD